MKKFVGICFIGLTMLLTGCVEHYEYEEVQGTVIYKEYDPAETTVKTVTNLDGEKVKKNVYEAEEYEVTIRYEDIEREFDFSDDSFYKQVEIGDAVTLQLEKGIDKEGNTVTRNIQLSDRTIE